MSIQEEAKKAYEERQANIAKRDREYEQCKHERNRTHLLDAIKRVFNIGLQDPRLQRDGDSDYALIDGLRFRYDENRDGKLRRLQVELPCHLCGEPSWQEIGDLVDLGYCLADPKNVTHLAFTCQWKEEEEPEQPAEAELPETWKGSFCPLINDDCRGDLCGLRARCQESLAVSELAEVVEQKADLEPAQWAVVSLMGHSTLVGQISEGRIAGITLTRIDIPTIEDRPGYTRYLSRGAIYDITPIDEQTAMAMLHWHKPPRPIDWTLLPPELRPAEMQPKSTVLHSESDEQGSYGPSEDSEDDEEEWEDEEEYEEEEDVLVNPDYNDLI